jgi:hypothetical protein
MPDTDHEYRYSLGLDPVDDPMAAHAQTAKPNPLAAHWDGIGWHWIVAQAAYRCS